MCWGRGGNEICRKRICFSVRLNDWEGGRDTEERGTEGQTGMDGGTSEGVGREGGQAGGREGG